jgi:hypothetical protein
LAGCNFDYFKNLDGKVMNNEPVAWMDKETGQVSRVACYDIPLYTHPAKTLTDEEIMALWKVKHPNVMSLNPDLLDFARAILRKAQEK